MITPWQLKQAVLCLRQGGLIAYPTEAIYGLGCDPFNAEAVQHLLTLKNRPQSKGLILIAADFSQFLDLLEPLSKKVMARIHASSPGANTWVCPARPDAPIWLRGNHNSLAVRITHHPLAKTLCSAWGGPIVSTSANLTGHRPARNALQVRKQFANDIDIIINHSIGNATSPSRIHDAISQKILRT